MTNPVKFIPRIKELRFLLSQTLDSSRGARDFLTKYYLPMKSANPQVKMLIREAPNISPKCYARYEYGKEAFVTVADNTAEEIVRKLEELNRF